MMPKSWIICLAIGLIAGALISFPAGRASVKIPKCPEIKPGVVTVTDTTLLPPEQTTTLTGDNLKPKPRVTERFEANEGVAGKIIERIEDTVNCYEGYRKFDDGAEVAVTACSKAFDPLPPIDLSMQIDYQPPPKIHSIEKRIDTIFAPCPGGRRFGWTVGPYAGIGYGLRGPEVSVGLAITWGVRIGELTKRGNL